ncbi:MAG: hypothetical protein H6518_03160 [Microthrixaceae bacterium]|nr:hypothetical protein [Microthrixaceae bacterium]
MTEPPVEAAVGATGRTPREQSLRAEAAAYGLTPEEAERLVARERSGELELGDDASSDDDREFLEGGCATFDLTEHPAVLLVLPVLFAWWLFRRVRRSRAARGRGS